MIFLFPLDGADGRTYPLTITNDDSHTEVCQVTVADTTAPEVKVQDVTVYVGGEVTLEDLLVEATDLAGDVTTKLLQEIDTTTAGTYKATDPNGNVATVECTITVRKDEDAPVFSGLKDLTTGVTATDARDGKVDFAYEGVALVPGAAFDPSVLPEADSVFTVPSCAIEGTDNVYSYPVLELTAYKGDSVISIEYRMAT